MQNIPLASIDEITPEWLTRVLRDGGYLTDGTVSDIQTRSHKSPNASNAVIRLSYSADAMGEKPTKLFFKLCDPGNNSFGNSEIVYYTTIAAEISHPPIPHCYHSAYLKEQGKYHLLLEDLSDSHAPNRNVKPTRERATKTIAAMAQLHASWWNHPKLSLVGEFPNRSKLEKYVSFAQRGLAPMLDDGGAGLSQEWLDLIHHIFGKHGEKMIERAGDGKDLTCIHGDLNPGNILSPIESSGRTYLIDRQPFDWSLTVWLGISDLAYMMVHWWDTEIRRELEKPLVESYHQQLMNLGIRSYPFDHLWSDYRLCAMQSLYVATAWCVDTIERKEYKWVWWPQLKKTMAACVDLKCVELLQ